MSNKLFEQDWVISGVNPSTQELEYLNQNYEEVIRRINLEVAKGVSTQTATIKVCKEMLGK